MAVKMNRTLALPPFFKHWGTDTTVDKKSTPVDASTRLDIDHLRNLITILSKVKKYSLAYCSFSKFENFK